jgi:hypothetical protein
VEEEAVAVAPGAIFLPDREALVDLAVEVSVEAGPQGTGNVAIIHNRNSYFL